MKATPYKPSPRTREAIHEEYNFHIANAGHKTTTVKLLEEEILEHFDRAASLRKESAFLPEEKPETTPPAPPAA